MRVLSLRLVNYIGIYNGLGLNEIFIDFTKCKTKFIVIKGDNGAGKSTIMDACQPLPDGNECFIPGKQAEKYYCCLDNNIIYNIKIIHPVLLNGERATTKAYISRLMDEEEQLNTNGNISSFKDILYSEFKLDSNFVSLSQLSGTNQGLASKKPSERKKFVTAIIETLEVYNNIHKTLSKRSSIFKSMINSLITKINAIGGDEEKIKLSLTSVEQRLDKMNIDKNTIIEQIANYKSKVQLIDPDLSIQKKYDEIYSNLCNLNKERDTLKEKVNNLYSKLNIQQDTQYNEILSIYNKLNKDIFNLENEVHNKEIKINSLLLDREEEAKNIQIKTEKLNSLKSDYNYIDINKAIELSKQKLDQYENILKQINLPDIYSINKEEFILGLNTIKEIKEMIDIFKSGSEYEILEISISYIKNNSYPDVQSIDKEIELLSNQIKDKEFELQQFVILKDISSKLSMRPNKCKIDNCQFIKDSLDAFNKNPDDNIKRLESGLLDLNNNLKSKINQSKKYDNIVSHINQLRVLVRTIEKNSMILNKLPIRNIFSNRDILLEKIINGYDFNEIDQLYQYIDYANIIDEYKSEKNIYDSLNKDYEIYQSKNAIVEEIMNDITNLNIKLNNITNELENSNNSILEDKKIIASFKELSLDYDVLIKLMDSKNILDNQKTELISNYNNIKSNIVIIKDCLQNVDILQQNLVSLNNQIEPLIKERDTLKHGVFLIQEYKEELKEYNLKYEKIEVIKKYCSPTKGIQTIYMDLYMNKTLSMANELLSLLFNGEYVLGQYIINENEFRIPCIGRGIPNDDVSSMSRSQVAMIGMIISFALLQQSSTKYNILKLDEIDGGLDTNNRLQFFNVVEKQMDMLGVEQCMMVSHSLEFDTSNCDLIILKMNSQDIPDGNIIYQYDA